MDSVPRVWRTERVSTGRLGPAAATPPLPSPSVTSPAHTDLLGEGRRGGAANGIRAWDGARG